MKKFLAGIACWFIIVPLIHAQSIYSFQGLGSLNHQGMPNNVGMGEVGIGTPTLWHINTQNPANLVYNTFSTFQIGLEVDKRNFSGQDLSESETGGGLRFLSFAFPIMPGKWSSSFGILPYSSVKYNAFSENEIPNTGKEVTQKSNNRGEGGLTNLFWGNGFSIKKKIQVGVKMTYTFGAIEKNYITSIGGVDVPATNVSYQELKSYSNFNLQFGLNYRHEFSDERFLNFGAIFSPKTNLDGSSTLSLIRLANTGSVIETIKVGTQDVDFSLPSNFGYGMSYEKLNHYKVGFDLEFSKWSSSSTVDQKLKNSMKFAVGAEWVPDFDNVSSYWKRAKYVTGFNYHKLPYIVNNQELIDFGVSFGASLPVSGFSSLDLAFKWGRLGKATDGLLEETYYKIILGITINDRWFIKSKYD